MQKIDRPPYQALNHTGKEYLRPARSVGELQTPEDRLVALQSATTTISVLLGMPASRQIHFGTPVYEAFMKRPAAQRHQHKTLLMTRGCDVSLDHCPEYN